MKTVIKAQLKDLESIVEIDRQVIGNHSRKEFIKDSIEKETCLIAIRDNNIAGFLIYDTNFFGYSFISFVIVSPKERRKGHATNLLQHFVNNAPTDKIFSSTNQSNSNMQDVFRINGFTRSGIVENLDEGDPEIIYFTVK